MMGGQIGGGEGTVSGGEGWNGERSGPGGSRVGRGILHHPPPQFLDFTTLHGLLGFAPVK